MLNKLYNKNKLYFSLAWIIAYCVLMSAGDSVSAMIGLQKSITLPVGILLSSVLFIFLKKNSLFPVYGLCRSKASLRSMLYYLPIFVMLTANMWYGVTFNYGAAETLLYILSMFCVGFLEEVIFRGLLFGAMREDNPKAAVIVSSLTFGIGHMVNLVNGSGAELIPNLLQVIYASAVGFMFVMIYIKTNSLIGCIAVHGIFNALSVFANETVLTTERLIMSSALLTAVTGIYAIYLAFSLKNTKTR